MDVFNTMKALPNKLLNADGSITDFQGNILIPADEELAEVYARSRSIANKFLDNDGEIKTYAEISLDLFIVVDELPEFGEKNKIYLVPSKDFPGSFDEYFWNENERWDKIGEVKIDLSNYPNKEQMVEAIAANSVEDKAYTNEKLAEAKSYTDEAIKNIPQEPEVYYLEKGPGATAIATSGECFDFWKSVYDPENKNAFIVCHPFDGKIFTWYFKDHAIEHNKTYTAYSNACGKTEKVYSENTRIEVGIATIKLTIVDGEVTQIELHCGIEYKYFLETGVAYSKPYIPTSDGSPATKKYVDDQVNKIEPQLPQVFHYQTKAHEITDDDKLFWTEVYKANKKYDIVIFSEDSSPTSGPAILMKKGTLRNNAKVNVTANYIFVGNKSQYDSYTNIERNPFVTWSITITNEACTNVEFSGSGGYSGSFYLDTRATYATPFIPTNPGHPATKKYVDDEIKNKVFDALGGEY